MTQRQISVEISKLLRQANKEGVLSDVLYDITTMEYQSQIEYIPLEDPDYDEGLDILNR